MSWCSVISADPITSFSGPKSTFINLISAEEIGTATLKIPSTSVNFLLPETTGELPQLNTEERGIIQHLRPLFTAAKFSQALKGLEESWPEKPSPALHYIKAQVLTQIGKLKRAERHFTLSLQGHGDYIQGIRLLSALAFKQQQWQKAQQLLSKAITLGDQSPESFGQLGYLNLKLNSAISALNSYQRAYSLEPNNPGWQTGLLSSLSRSGANDLLNGFVDELLSHSPDNEELWLYKAKANLNKSSKLTSLSALEMAIRLGNKKIENLQLCVRLNAHEGNLERAIELIEKHPALASNFVFLQPLMTWMTQKNRWVKLEQVLSLPELKATQVKNSKLSNTQKSSLVTLRALLASHKKQTSHAKNLLQQAVNFNPSNGEALLKLARLYIENRQLQKADLILARAQRLNDVAPQALQQRAQVAYKQKRYGRAINYLKQVLQKQPHRRELIGNIQILERLQRSEA